MNEVPPPFLIHVIPSFIIICFFFVFIIFFTLFLILGSLLFVVIYLWWREREGGTERGKEAGNGDYGYGIIMAFCQVLAG